MQLSKETTSSLLQYFKKASAAFQFGAELRSNFEYIDREYSRKNNLGAVHQDAKNKNAAGDKSAIRDVTVPVLQPQTEAAHTYLSGVFLTGYPIFSAVTSPENTAAGDMMDAINTENSTKAGWVRNLSLAFRDGLKYNMMAVEVCWERRTTFSLQKNEKGKLGPKPIIWQGNYINHLNMYNTFWDTRVAPADVHRDGEFAGYYQIMSRVKLKQFLNDLPEESRLNGKEAFEAPIGEERFFVPNITDKLQNDPRRMEFDWLSWATNTAAKEARISYRNVYEVATLYARIIPEDFNLPVPARATPQIWKFIIVNSNVLIYAERQTNAHNYLPIIFGSPTEDGLSYQTLSFAENLLEIQDMGTSLWAARMAAARRNVSDRVIYDPMAIRENDINSNSPSAKIPIRPGSYGTDVRTKIFPLPFNDQSSNSLVRDAMQIVDFGRSISGINRGQEGQFTKGNRTLEEFDRTMNNSDARLQTMAIFIEGQFLVPIKEIIKYNVLQYAQPGQVYFPKSQQNLDINPQVMQDAALDFKLSDGLLPSSKIAGTEFLQSLLQLFTVPEVNAQFDIVGVISYLASQQNVPNLDSFRRQQNPAMQQQIPGQPQQAGGNVVQPNPNPAPTEGLPPQ